MTQRTGRCLCGAVQFTLTGEPLIARICWCRDCQHLAGNGTVNALFGAEQFSVTGTLAQYASKAESGNLITRAFCPACGAHIYAQSSARPQVRVVRVGNLDDPSSIKPSANIWVGSAPDWACMDARLERIDRQPAPPPGLATR